MKLFTKTLLFFIAVIIFGSALTILLITGLTRRVNDADARKELEAEASILYESFNSWKRQLWTTLVTFGSDPRFAGVLAATHGGLPRETFAGSVNELIFFSKVDDLILMDPQTGAVDILPVSYSTFAAVDLRGLPDVRRHPHLELRTIRDVLCLVGVTTIGVPPDRPVDVFIVKRIDTEFCSQLTRNRRSAVAFFQGGRYVVGSFARGQPTPSFDPAAMKGAYIEVYDRRIAAGRTNAAFQRLGRLEQRDDGEELFLGVFLSNDAYNERILLVSRAVLLVSAAASLLTIALALFSSRNITHPIAELLAGMERVKSGAYETRVGHRGGYEIARLFAGFNEMAAEVHRNRAALQEVLHQTVLLKEYNEKVITSIKVAIAIVNRDLVVEKANPSFLESFGLHGTEVIGVPLTALGIDLLDTGVLQGIHSILSSQRESYSEVKRSRNARVFEIKLYPFYSSEGEFRESSGCVFVAEDISAKVELEQKIFRAQKLSSISMLSAGMAHEINNPLSSILSNVQNLIVEETNPQRRVALEWIEQETRRIARVVRKLLDFAAADRAGPGCEVNRLVAETIGLMSHSLEQDGRIRVRSRLARGLPLTTVSPDELKQVVLNLITNAIQAIDGRGSVLICTRWRERDRRISLSVADTGRGIPKEVMPRIFDPFFTTKSNGVGTGLGLSVVYGIVTKYDGTIAVHSREGKGTRVALALPVQGAEAQGEDR